MTMFLYKSMTLLFYTMSTIDATKFTPVEDTSVTERTTSFFDNFYEVTSEGSDSFGALKECAENFSDRRHICVPYHHCDPETNTITQTGTYDGYGIINIR